MMKKFFACLLMLTLCLFALGAQAETLTVTQTVQPTVELPGSSEELFAYYVEQELYKPIYGEISVFGTSARAQLTAQQQLMYDALKEKIVAVANGGGSTQFVFDPTKIDGLEYTFTKAQLGVTEFTHIVAGESTFTDETFNAVSNIVFGDVLNALLHDCPLELYWFNKKAGMSQGFGGSISGDTLTITQFAVTMQVASAYQDKNVATPTVVESANLEDVLKNAQTVVTDNAGKTDREKLAAFKNYICSLVEYNDAAADNSSTPYGDPWQLIYVFDGDGSTNVVCEGYSKAFQYLCDLAGLECYTVSGTMTGGTGAGRHMWNIVTLGGENCLVDVTNCDTDTIGAPDLLFLEEPIRGSVAEGYVFAGRNSQEVTYRYDKDLIWGNDVLTLVTGPKLLLKAVDKDTNQEIKGYFTGVVNSYYPVDNKEAVGVALNVGINRLQCEVPWGEHEYKEPDYVYFNLDQDGRITSISDNVLVEPMADNTWLIVVKMSTTTNLPDTTDRATVSVVDGAGTGEYLRGRTVTIQANDKTDEGKRFVNWEDTSNLSEGESRVEFADNTEQRTTFTMPARSVQVTANYEDIPTYTVIWKNADGTELEKDVNVREGTTPTYNGSTPTKAATTQYTYSFAGWDPKISSVNSDQTYTATYTATPRTYTITFKDTDGSTITSFALAYGTAVTAPDDPTKTGYTFAGWDKKIPTTMPAENLTINAKWTVNQYTISFNTDGGTEIAPITQDYGTAVTAPAAPTKVGHTFAGWDVEIPATMPAQNLTITAKWTVNQYTITFNTNGGTAIASIQQAYGTAVTPPDDPTKTGYTFAGWDKKIPTTMPAENLTITAQWESITYAITFDRNGGEFSTEDVTEYVLSTGADGKLTQEQIEGVQGGFQRKGYLYDHSNTAQKGSGVKIDKDYVFSADTTVYVQWKPITYTVRFHANGGSGTMNDQVFTYDEAQNLHSNTFTRTGYVFDGWSTEVNGFGQKYKDEMLVGNLEDANGAVKDLYAIWKQVHTITVRESNFGTGVATPTSFASGGENVILEVTPNPGYTLEEVRIWVDGVNGGVLMPVNESNPNKLSGYTTTSIELEMEFKPIKYTIQFNANGGEGEAYTQQFEYDRLQRLAENTFTRTGYTFMGWNTKADGTGTFYAAGTEVKNLTTENGATVHLYAQWRIEQYTITFDTKGGTAVAPITQDYGTAVPDITQPTKTGYIFAGWDKAIPANMPAEDMTITAQWTPITYTVTWKNDNGDVLSKESVPYGTIPSYEGETPTKASDAQHSYAFSGWTPEVVKVTGDATYTAVYTESANSYTITYTDGVADEEIFADQVYSIAYGAVPMAFVGTPQRTGYTFAGWDKEIPETMPAKDLTITAQWRKQYTIRFVNDDGTELQAIKVDYGELPVYAGETPTKANVGTEKYTFKGWIPEIVAVTGDATYTATYTTSTIFHTVTWLNEAGETIATESVVHGGETTKNIAVPEKEGYTGKWDHDGKNIVQDTTIRPVYTINSYKLTWSNGDGGSYEQDMDYGKLITVPSNEHFDDTMRKAGYTLTGWLNTDGYEVGDAMPAQALTFTAQYEVNQYTITFDTDGGTEIAPITQDYGTAVTAPAAPTKEGYVFTGWEKTIPTTMPAENLTIKASWTEKAPDIYTVTVTNDGNGAASASPAAGVAGTEITLTATANTGYQFKAWEVISGGVTVQENKFTIGTENVEIKATFEAIPAVKTYTVTFVDWNGNTLKTETVEAGKAATAPANPSREGYTFTGWDVEFSNVTTDLTVTAQYQKNQPAEPTKYTVTFVDWDGKTLKTETVEAGKAATAPADPSREGYTFTGWDVEFSNVTTDLTVTAQYQKNQPVEPTKYTVTFVDWDGKLLKTEIVEAGKAATAPVDPSREGYTFTGWDKAFTNVTADLTVTAQYRMNHPPVVAYNVTVINGTGSGVYEPGESVVIGADVMDSRAFVGWQGADGLIFTSGNANTPNATFIMPARFVRLTATYEEIPEPGKDVIITSPTEERIIVVYEDERAEMAITAENAAAYQWYVNYNDGTGWHRLGVNSPAYTTEPTILANDGNRYKCVATGENGSTAESVIFHLCVLERVDVPETGDHANLLLLSAMLLLSGAGCLLLAKSRKRMAN